MNNKRQMHFNELEQNHMSRFLTVYSSLCVKVHSFIIAKGIYCQARDDGGINEQTGGLIEYIHFILLDSDKWHEDNNRKKGEEKKAKFSKPTKKTGEELAAKKRCQQNFGSSEIEYKRKLKSTLAARGPEALRIRPLHNMSQKAQERQIPNCSEL